MRFFLFLMLIGFSTSSLAGMKKCQDSEGKWHYGDTAVKSCENSKITTLTKRGFIDAEQSPPKTFKQLRDEEDQAELLAQQKADEKSAMDDRLRILSIYETESDIDRQRDNQLNAVKSKINVHDAYIKGMEARIARFKTKLEQLKTAPAKKDMDIKIAQAKVRMADSVTEREVLVSHSDEIMLRFAKEKEIYLDLKGKQ